MRLARSAVPLLPLLLVCGTLLAQADFEPIAAVRIDATGGMPRLLVNGKPRVPLLFMPNTDVPFDYAQRMLREQVALARDAGFHLYQFPARIGRKNDGRDPDYAHTDRQMELISGLDPQAWFILRVYPGPWPFWAEWKDIPKDDIATFADGSQNFISIGSDWFWKPANEDLAKFVRHVEEGAYGNRILGYIPGGPEHENFMDSYREKGPDCSAANTRRFRAWLRDTYATDAALQAAWGRATVTLDSARVPVDPARFPMHTIRAGETAGIFYELPGEQDWVDYSRYGSDIVSARQLKFARTVRAASAGKRLVGFFYGYTFELCGSFSGHYRLDRLLASPDIDFLGSPYSYTDRKSGGAGAFMSPIDSVTAHGKLWLNEDDTRTGVIKLDEAGDMIKRLDPLLFNGEMLDGLAETLGVLDRNLASVLMHRAGLWWLDLYEVGAFNHPGVFSLARERARWFAELAEQPEPYRPEAAIIIDEASKLAVRSDWDASCQNLMITRDESLKCGAQVGFYTLADFIAGLVPVCRAYVFANAFVLSDEQAQAIRKRLDNERAAALWLYAPGCYGPQGFDAALAARVTGIGLTAQPGRQGSTGVGPWAGEAWGWDAPVVPRPIIAAAAAEPLGHYRDGGAVSAARKRTGDHTAWVVCDLTLNRAILRRFFEASGVHIWTRGGEVINTDGRLLAIQAGKEGDVRIELPKGVTAMPLSGGSPTAPDADGLTVAFRKCDTLWFRLARGAGR